MRRGLMAALLVSTGLIATACGGSAGTSSFKPGGSSTPASPGATTSQAQPSASSVVMPPFGKNVRIVMTPWLPARAGETPAVITAKNFLLAVLYADYTGGQDHRWEAYAGSSVVRNGMASTLAAPSVTTESFTGTIRIWHMSAIAGKNTIAVTECVDSARARNTSLSTGQVLPRGQQNSTDQNYYSNTDILSRNAAGQWTVISIPATIYYPQALECKP